MSCVFASSTPNTPLAFREESTKQRPLTLKRSQGCLCVLTVTRTGGGGADRPTIGCIRYRTSWTKFSKLDYSTTIGIPTSNNACFFGNLWTRKFQRHRTSLFLLQNKSSSEKRSRVCGIFRHVTYGIHPPTRQLERRDCEHRLPPRPEAHKSQPPPFGVGQPSVSLDSLRVDVVVPKRGGKFQPLVTFVRLDPSSCCCCDRRSMMLLPRKGSHAILLPVHDHEKGMLNDRSCPSMQSGLPSLCGEEATCKQVACPPK